MKINSLTHAEEALMQILWKLESAYLRDIIAEYSEPKPHQNTVSTFLKILLEKEFLISKKEGRINKYSAAVPFADYRNFLLQKFLRDYYNDSAEELLNSLIEQKMLDSTQANAFFKSKKTAAGSTEKENPVSEFIEEITADPKPKRKKKDKKKKKKK